MLILFFKQKNKNDRVREYLYIVKLIEEMEMSIIKILGSIGRLVVLPKKNKFAAIINKFLLYFNTIKYLKLSQIITRLRNIIKLKFIDKKKSYQKCYFSNKDSITPVYSTYFKTFKTNHLQKKHIYNFLNTTINTQESWFPTNASQLWIFNLHYFAYLSEINNQNEFEEIILSWINNVPPLTKNGWHPYTISLRTCNWIWAFSSYSFSHQSDFLETFFNSLRNQLSFLSSYLEFDVLGNHLIENCKALIIGGLFFQDINLINKGLRVLQKQLKEQILADGGHYERSPMYHAVILLDLLNIYEALQKSSKIELNWLLNHIIKMNSFLKKIEYNSHLPLLNDSAKTPLFNQIQSLLPKITNSDNIKNYSNTFLLEETGLFIFKTSKTFLCFDIGKIGPDFLCAHAHNDLLSFVLHLNGEELMNDSGVFEYQKGENRQHFRSTAAHNTIQIDDIEQNQIWSSFRVAKRGYPRKSLFDKDKNIIKCSHNCYQDLGITISRSINYSETKVSIEDTVQNKNNNRNFQIFFHLANGVDIDKHIKNNEIKLQKNGKLFKISFSSKYSIQLSTSYRSEEFGVKYKRYCIIIKGQAYTGTTIIKSTISIL